MPRGRRAAAKPLSIGIAGVGELSPKTIIPMLDDLLDGAKLEALYIPVTETDFTDEVAAVVKWAVAAEHAYTTISDEAAAKDPALKKVIADAADDYDAGDSAGKAIVELLAGDEAEPVANGRLLMFFNPDDDEDVAVFEEAHDLEVPAYDLRDGMSAMTLGDDDDSATPAPEPEPEEAPPARRGRRGGAAAPEATPEGPDDSDGPHESSEELLKLSLVELKKRAKAADPKANNTESLRGLDKAQVVDLLLGTDDDAEARQEATEAEADANAAASRAPADEAQTTARPTGRGRAAQEPQEGPEDEADAREDAFSRVRGQREMAERIGAGISAMTRAKHELAPMDTKGLEVGAGALAAALMDFAEYIITEVRKPKSAGRPRKDGTEAQPKSTAEEPAPTRRGRRST